MSEVSHLQEMMHNLCLQASEPNALPPSTEQVLADLKGLDPATLNLQGKRVSGMVQGSLEGSISWRGSLNCILS